MRYVVPVIAIASVLIGCGSHAAESVEEISVSDAEAIASAAAIEVTPTDWPWWRGASRDNRADSAVPPLEWGETENVVWKVAVPGEGHASPAVWGSCVLVTSAEEADQTQTLFCYDRASGDLKWQREIHQGGFMKKKPENTYASATCACDGERVYCAFLHDRGLWVTAVDLEGNIVWQREAGPFTSQHGYGSSPVLFKSLVIVSGDNPGSSFLAALDCASGEVKWRVRRPNKPCYSTPVVAHVAGRDQLLLSGHSAVTSYDPATGELLWKSEGPADVIANTAAWLDDLVFTSGGYPQNGIMAIRADGSGEVVWSNQIKAYVPSPLVVGERLLIVQDDGIAHCFDARTGNEAWKQRLGGSFYASPTLSGQYVFVPNKEGTMFVFRCGDKFVAVAENDMQEGCTASPVICGGRLYQRTSGHLVCIGK